jgi:hypothetical protein
VNQQSCPRAGKQHVLGLPAQRESGGVSSLESQRCLKEGDRFLFQEAGFTIADPKRTRSDGVERNAPAPA